MDLEQFKVKLAKELDEKRFIHSINCMETAINLATHYGVDITKAALAGLLHDCGKNYKGDEARAYVQKIGYIPDEIEFIQTRLLHGIIGAHLARVEYGIEDEEVLSAIRWHTTGRAGMALLEKIIYIADYIEPARSFDDIDQMRAEAYQDLELCIVHCSDSTIDYILKKGVLLHHKTVETRNDSILAIKARNPDQHIYRG